MFSQCFRAAASSGRSSANLKLAVTRRLTRLRRKRVLLRDRMNGNDYFALGLPLLSTWREGPPP